MFLVKNRKVTSQYSDRLFPLIAMKEGGKTLKDKRVEKEEKSPGEKRRSKEGKMADKEEGRKGKQRLIM